MQLDYASSDDLAAVRAAFEAVVSNALVYNEAARSYNLALFSQDHLASLIDDDPKAIAICRIEGDLAGFIITEDQDGPIWIEWIGTVDRYRKSKVAEALVQFSIEEALGRGGNKVWCDTRDENPPAIALFTKMGFKQICHLENHWHGQGFFLWEKVL